MLNWEDEYPAMFDLHGPHLAPIWAMPEGPEKQALAELLTLLKTTGMRLIKNQGGLILDIEDMEKVASHPEQTKRIEEITKEYYEVIKQYLGPAIDAGL